MKVVTVRYTEDELAESGKCYSVETEHHYKEDDHKEREDLLVKRYVFLCRDESHMLRVLKRELEDMCIIEENKIIL